MLIARLGLKESSFRHWLTHSSGALGIMGIMPKYWDFLPWYLCGGKYAKYLDRHGGTNVQNVMKFIDLNVEMGCYILRYYIDLYDGDIEKGLLKYGGFMGIYSNRIELKEKYLEEILGD
jgi:hypothetical protein